MVLSTQLSNDGSVHSFGRNSYGKLGLGHLKDVSVPTPIPNLPQINVIFCGWYFTVCVDYEGFMWSFGENTYGQLGTGNRTHFKVPQKILSILLVLSVSCGSQHTLIITTDPNLVMIFKNDFGELCLGNKEKHLKAQKTTFQKYQWKLSFQKQRRNIYFHVVRLQPIWTMWIGS